MKPYALVGKTRIYFYQFIAVLVEGGFYFFSFVIILWDKDTDGQGTNAWLNHSIPD